MERADERRLVQQDAGAGWQDLVASRWRDALARRMTAATARVDAAAAAAGMTREQRGALDASLRSLLAYLADHAVPDTFEPETVDVHREDVDLFVRASARTAMTSVPSAEAARLRATAPAGGSVDVSLDRGQLVTVVQVPVPDQRPSPRWS